MKSMKLSTPKILPVIMLAVFLASCSKTPQPIVYGHDTCNFCHSTIGNNAFAAQALTIDGIQYNYDSIECLVQHVGDNDSEMAVIKVADYQHPGNMLNADQSYYILNPDTSGTVESQPSALRHNRANTLIWNELKSQVLQHTDYAAQKTEVDNTNRY